jgi:microsomal prostaglandin-E synthase 2
MLPRRISSISAALIASTLPSNRKLHAEEVALVRQIPQGLDLHMSQVTIYQYESCPFCRKVRSILDYARVPYEIVEVHPLTKAETKSFAGDYGKVPILRVDGVQMRDSSKIVEEVLKYVENKQRAAGIEGSVGQEECLNRPLPTAPLTEKCWKVSPADKGIVVPEGAMDAASEWVSWTDEYLVQLVVMNIYRTVNEARQTFDYLLTHKDFSFFSKLVVYWSGVAVMTVVAGKRRSRFNVNKGDERDSLYTAMKMFIADGLDGGSKTFLGGDRPNKADFNVYGVIRSTEGFDTQRDLFEKVPEIRVWYEAMRGVCGESTASGHKGAGLRGIQRLGAAATAYPGAIAAS